MMFIVRFTDLNRYLGSEYAFWIY